MPPKSPDTPLLGLPRQPLTPQQQLEAIRRMQNQAEQRVKLGMQLFKAVEARVSEQRDVLAAIREHEQQVRDQVHEDVARTLQQYDQWMGKIDEGFTQSLRKLEERFEQLERSFQTQRTQMETLVQRAEQLLLQARRKLDTPEVSPPPPPPPEVSRQPQVSQQSQASQPPRPQTAARPPISALLKKIQPPPTSVPRQTAPPPPPEVPEVSQSSQLPPSAPPPASDADADDSFNDKIYSRLLRRLRQEPPASEDANPQDHEDDPGLSDRAA